MRKGAAFGGFEEGRWRCADASTTFRGATTSVRRAAAWTDRVFRRARRGAARRHPRRRAVRGTSGPGRTLLRPSPRARVCSGSSRASAVPVRRADRTTPKGRRAAKPPLGWIRFTAIGRRAAGQPIRVRACVTERPAAPPTGRAISDLRRRASCSPKSRAGCRRRLLGFRGLRAGTRPPQWRRRRRQRRGRAAVAADVLVLVVLALVEAGPPAASSGVALLSECSSGGALAQRAGGASSQRPVAALAILRETSPLRAPFMASAVSSARAALFAHLLARRASAAAVVGW